MRGRMVGLGLVAACELLAGIGLRNECMAARARAEINRRRQLLTEARLVEHRALLAAHLSSDALLERLEFQRRMAEQARIPEL